MDVSMIVFLLFFTSVVLFFAWILLELRGAGCLAILNGPCEYSVDRGRFHFDRTTRARSVSRESELRIRGDRLVGCLVHGPQKTWSIDIDIRFDDVPAETIALAVILACDRILSAHHGD